MLYLAADHQGLKLKNQLKSWLSVKKIAFKDLGAYEPNPNDDYPDFAQAVAQKVVEDPENKGVLLCGSGAGVCIAANKIKGIRCAIGFNYQQVERFVQHDDINVLAIAADYTSKFKVFQLVKTFINTSFIGEERHRRRLEKVRELEK